MSDQNTDLTQKALDTLQFFGWVVVEEKEHTLTVADDHSGPYVTSYSSLNSAALSADQRQDILDSDDPEARYDAHCDWCSDWDAWEQ